MRYTVHELEKMKFPLRIRGYDRREVDRVMLEVARQTEELLSEIDRLKAEVRQLRESLSHYQNLEETMQKSLMMAQQTAEEKIAQANREAESIIREARRHEGVVRQEIARLEALRDQLVLEIHGLLTRFLSQLGTSYPELVKRADELTGQKDSATSAPPSVAAGPDERRVSQTGKGGEARQERPLPPPPEEAAEGPPREDELPSMVPPDPPGPARGSEQESASGGSR